MNADDATRVCHPPLIDASPAMKLYTECEDAHPSHSQWAQLIATSKCVCDSGMKQAIDDAHCCGSDWGIFYRGCG